MDKLLAFVKSHGHDAVIYGGKVIMEIPFVSANGDKGFETVTVSTYHDARIALGY